MPVALAFATSPASYPPINPATGGPTGASLLGSTLAVIAIFVAAPVLLGLGAGSRPAAAGTFAALAAHSLFFLFVARGDHTHREPLQIVAVASLLVWAWLVPRWLRRFDCPAGSRPWLLAFLAWGAVLPAVAAVSIVCHSFPALLVAATGIGAAIGLLTVAVAAALPEIVPRRSMGLAAGLATGAAYFVSNVPALFEADPVVRALFPAVLALVACGPHPRPLSQPHSRTPGRGELDISTGNPLWGLLPRTRLGASEDGRGGRGVRAETAMPLQGPTTPAEQNGNAPGLARLLLVFLVLIWLDSAAFAIVQANPDLKAQTWGSDAQKLAQGSVHFLAAAGAGALLDLGLGLAVPLMAWVLFAVAFPLLQHGGAAAGPLYAAGISFYSTALVFFPSRQGPGSLPPRWLGEGPGVRARGPGLDVIPVVVE